MAVTMKDVRALLDPEEPNYEEAAKLGPEALPHLQELIGSGDQMLASKATYAASLVGDSKSEEVIAAAAQSADPVVRVAAASAARNLPASGSSNILVDLVADPDPGVRKVARSAVPAKPTAKLTRRLDEIGDEPELEGAGREPGGPVTGQPMPGEMPDTSTGGTMPGEGPGRMPGEQDKMPGE